MRMPEKLDTWLFKRDPFKRFLSIEIPQKPIGRGAGLGRITIATERMPEIFSNALFLLMRDAAERYAELYGEKKAQPLIDQLNQFAIAADISPETVDADTKQLFILKRDPFQRAIDVSKNQGITQASPEAVKTAAFQAELTALNNDYKATLEQFRTALQDQNVPPSIIANTMAKFPPELTTHTLRESYLKSAVARVQQATEALKGISMGALPKEKTD